MTEFPVKDYWKIYLNEEAKEKLREIQDHLDENYENRSEFLREALKDEQALSLEERIRRLEEEREETDKQIEQLKRIKQEREQQDKLRDKRELLKEKQKKLREAQESDSLTREEAEEQVFDELEPRSTFSDMSRSEIRDTRAFQKKVEELCSEVDIDELVEDINRLQQQVAELNGGEEDYFMDLETVDEVKA